MTTNTCLVLNLKRIPLNILTTKPQISSTSRRMCDVPPCPPCPPPPPPPCSQVCPPPPPLPPCRSKPIMCGLHWAQTKRTLAQAIVLSIVAGAAAFIFGMKRKEAYKEYYKRGCFDEWADEMARKGLFQAVPKESLVDHKKEK